MARALGSLTLALALVGSAASGEGQRRPVPEFFVDLDAAPEERFGEVVRHFNASIHRYFDGAWNKLVKIALREAARKRGPENTELMAEVRGAARLTGIPEPLLQAAQMEYELNKFMVPIINFTFPWSGLGCTGIVATNKADGMVYHARNLDLGPAKYLQDLVYTGIFKKGGRELFRAQMIAAYNMPMTGLKKGPNGFAVETNTRYPDHERGLVEIMRNLFVEKRPLNGWVVRKVLETANSYEEAVEALSKTKYTATMYHIISGIKKGAILTRNPDGLDYEMRLGRPNYQCRDDYIIMTNFDYFWHDRREWFDPTGGRGVGHPRRIAAQKILNATDALTPDVLFAAITDIEVQAGDTIFQAIINVETGLWNVSLPACAKCIGNELPASEAMLIV